MDGLGPEAGTHFNTGMRESDSSPAFVETFKGLEAGLKRTAGSAAALIQGLLRREVSRSPNGVEGEEWWDSCCLETAEEQEYSILVA